MGLVVKQKKKKTVTGISKKKPKGVTQLWKKIKSRMTAEEIDAQLREIRAE